MNKQSYTLREIADRWSCCHSSVLSLVKTGQLTAIDISTNPSGRSRFIVRADDLDDIESRRTVSPPVTPPKRVKVKRPDVIQFIN